MTPPGRMPEEQRADTALVLAAANYLFHATHGATLGMHRQSGDVSLALRVPSFD